MIENLEKYSTRMLLTELMTRDAIREAEIKEANMVPMQQQAPPAQPAPPGQNPAGWPIVCSGCGKNTTVPFQPTPGWKVFCLECHNAKKAGQQTPAGGQ